MAITIDIKPDRTFTADFNLPAGVDALTAVHAVARSLRTFITKVYPEHLHDAAFTQAITALATDTDLTADTEEETNGDAAD